MFYEPPQKWTEELLDGLPFGEDDRYERKSGDELSRNDFNQFFKKLTKEIGAFANSFGGTLFLGIADDNKKIGVPEITKGRNPTVKWLEDKIPVLFELRLQHIRVSTVELTEETQRKIGKDNVIIAVDVYHSELAPHQCVLDHTYYYRINSTSKPAPHHYLAFLWGRANSNISSVVTWWIDDFISPTLKLLEEIYEAFSQKTFSLKTSVIKAYYYRIFFIKKDGWNNLLKSSVGEYYLSTAPLVEKELSSFTATIDDFEIALDALIGAIKKSDILLNNLKTTYARLGSGEHISNSQFEHSGLEEIISHVLGQLKLNISKYPVESEASLVNSIAYALLELNVSLDVNTTSEGEALLNMGHEMANTLKGNDDSISQALEATRRIMSEISSQSSCLIQHFKKDRLDLAKRYTATFGQNVKPPLRW